MQDTEGKHISNQFNKPIKKIAQESCPLKPHITSKPSLPVKTVNNPDNLRPPASQFENPAIDGRTSAAPRAGGRYRVTARRRSQPVLAWGSRHTARSAGRGPRIQAYGEVPRGLCGRCSRLPADRRTWRHRRGRGDPTHRRRRQTGRITATALIRLQRARNELMNTNTAPVGQMAAGALCKAPTWGVNGRAERRKMRRIECGFSRETFTPNKNGASDVESIPGQTPAFHSANCEQNY